MMVEEKRVQLRRVIPAGTRLHSYTNGDGDLEATLR